jgi:peroxiredoxin
MIATGEDVRGHGVLQCLAGDTEEGLKTVADQVKRRPTEVIPLARLAFLEHQNGDQDIVTESFEKLRDTSSSMDLDVKLFDRLAPLADELKLNVQWQKKPQPAVDLGFRPSLDSLGPFRWSPPAAPNWSLKDSDNKTVDSNSFAGQPHLVIFYLGHGCLHCAEQLQAFAPRVGDFENAGIKMLAISTDGPKGLQQSIEDAGQEMPIRLASDEANEVFKRFRAYDDFEDQPLHGTFLIDGAGKIRWQDIGYEPFMEHQFLLDEAKRLLADELGEESQASRESTAKQVSNR